jgi:hypothetical protein
MNISNILTASAQLDPVKPAVACDNEIISNGELDRSATVSRLKALPQEPSGEQCPYDDALFVKTHDLSFYSPKTRP